VNSTQSAEVVRGREMSGAAIVAYLLTTP